MTEDIKWDDAARENVHCIIALAGASGSGKTKSALELATGLAGPGGSIFMADTEARRALHYANAPGEADPGKYRFRHYDMLPPFRPQRFEDVIGSAENAGANVLIVDSFSHEWDGEGGMMDWNAEIAEGIPKPGIENPRDPKSDSDGWKDWLQKPLDGPGAWKVPKAAHKHLVQTTVLQARCHVIFCLRAEEKLLMLKKGDTRPDGTVATKAEVHSKGWQPICEKRFMYEMTLSFTLNPAAPGVPQFDLPHKLQDQHRPFFPEGERITRDAGSRLAEWARGGKAPDSIEAYGREVNAHLRGDDADQLTAWWQETAARRDALAIPAERLGKMAAAVTSRISTLRGGD